MTLKCGPNDELSMTTKRPAGADDFPVFFFFITLEPRVE